MTPEMSFNLFYLFLASATLSTVALVQNPYRLRHMGQQAVNRLLPAGARDELQTASQAWAGQVRMSERQLTLFSILGAVVGMTIGLFIYAYAAMPLLLLLTLVLGVLGYFYPRSRFRGGFPRTLLSDLEREAVLLSAFMYRMRAVGMSQPVAWEAFRQYYADTRTAKLLADVPPGVSYSEALLGLEFPADEVDNWLSVISTLDTIQQAGNPVEILDALRETVAQRESQWLRAEIKRKAFTAPVMTVILILPGLMAVLLGAIVLQAIRGLSGSGVF